MLIAKNDNNQWVHAHHATKTAQYHCPDCHSKLIVKSGPKIIPHFAHVKKCLQHRFSEGESAEHLTGKQLLYDTLTQLGYNVQLEPYLKTLKQRPDLLVIVNDKPVVIEFQCSVIPIDVVEKRTRQYIANQYHVIWIVGQKNAKLKQLTYYYLSSNLYQFYLDCVTKKLYVKTNTIIKNVPFDCLFHSVDLSHIELLAYSENNMFQSVKYFKRRFLQFLYAERYTIHDIPTILLSQKSKVFGTQYQQYEWLAWLYIYQKKYKTCTSLQHHFQQYARIDATPLITQSDLVNYYMTVLAKRFRTLLNKK